MKILIANTRFYPGGGDISYVLNLADLLRAHGHQVAFFAMQDERNLPDPNSDLFVSHIDFREINRKKNPLNAIKVFYRVIYSSEARQRFAKLLDRFKPDIIHLNNIYSHISPSIIFEAQQRNIPMVWTVHDYRMVCPNSHLLNDRTGEICDACRGRRYYQAMGKRCKKGSLLASAMASAEAYAYEVMSIERRVDALLAPSNFLRNKLIESGFNAQRITHLPLFLRSEYFRMNPPSGDYLLFMGRLEPIKGVRVLLEASRLAPGAQVMLAGSVEEPILSQIKAHGLKNVTYVGLKHGQELLDLVDHALAVVVPSVWYENQPFSILEAFAASKPVIASNLGGMSELVSHQERGLLVEPGNPAALAQALDWAVSNPQNMAAMGDAAYLYAQVNHSPQSHYESLSTIYEKNLRGVN